MIIERRGIAPPFLVYAQTTDMLFGRFMSTFRFAVFHIFGIITHLLIKTIINFK
jgi:hypothetical protein